MDQTIIIVASCDTKHQEAAFMRRCVEAAGVRALVVDVATGPGPSLEYDISREETAMAAGVSWREMEGRTKGEKISYMKQAVSCLVSRLFWEGSLDGILAAGGLQNTVMATEAMKALPLGVPKVMATTVACGSRKFEDVVGEKDIVVLPSICDFTGLNMVTERILEHACACCTGMVKLAKGPLEKKNGPVIGVTLMGITNTGACGAIDYLKKHGVEAVGFHATGAGGPIMEELAEEGLIDGILDMNLHEIASGYFARGFSYNKRQEIRLWKSIRNRIPLVIAPGGLDFADFALGEFPDRMEERVYMMHNHNMAHIKLLPEEAAHVAEEIRRRLIAADYPVKLLLPTEGMRSNTRPGEELYDPEVDRRLLEGLRAMENPWITIEEIPGNLNTQEWGIEAAKRMLEELKREEICEKSKENRESVKGIKAGKGL